MRKTAVQAGFEIGLVAIAWVMLYWFNGWIFASFSVTESISWIFLPAAIRIIAVIVFDWRGISGLFVGAVITSGMNESHWVVPVLQAAVSALAPYIALLMCKKLLKLNSTLHQITPRQVVLVAGAGAFSSSSLHNIFFALTGSPTSFCNNFTPMFVGDLIGTAMVLTVASVALRFGRNTSER